MSASGLIDQIAKLQAAILGKRLWDAALRGEMPTDTDLEEWFVEAWREAAARFKAAAA